MAPAEMEEITQDRYTCINCGNIVKSLYKKYSATVLKLTECGYCKNVADKYVEYDTVIVVIDLILLRIMAYRHFLFNYKFKNYWKLSLVLLILETYSNWVVTKKRIYKLDLNDTKPYLHETDIYLDDFRFYKMSLSLATGTASFIILTYILTMIYTYFHGREGISVTSIFKAITLSSCGMFLLLPSLIWDMSVHEFHMMFISLYTTLSQLLAHKEKRGSKNGIWVWDEYNNGIAFVNRDQKDNVMQKLHSGGSQPASINSAVISKYDAFKDTIGIQSQIKFRKHYQRKEKATEKNVVILQDIKDVAIYLCNINLLTLEFISYFHTKAMDKFLRSLIIYFQYYFQVWNQMQKRRKEASRKLRQPLVTVLEDVIRDDLADLRSMVARDYAAILTGIGDAKEFHHLNKKNNVSLSDKDRRHFETMLLLAERVIWIALRRKRLSVIEKEINRLFRTDTFNPIDHGGVKLLTNFATPEEQRILKGKACAIERKLLQRSPAIQEIILDNHDYKMLAIGVTDVGNSDERQRYLEAAYAAPEELLEDLEIGIGILGKPRKFFDPLLKPMEISTTKKRASVMKLIPEFVIPPRCDYRDHELPETLPRKPCKYWETKSSKESRKNQCKLWREYVDLDGQLPFTFEMLSMSPSFVTLRTSIAPVYSKYN